MKQLQTALTKAASQTPNNRLREMTELALKRSMRPKRAKRKPIADPVKDYHQMIKSTEYDGLGALHPCSFINWRPGSAVKVDGDTGRIKWGLTDGKVEVVVILFDYQRSVTGVKGVKSFYGFSNVEHLQPCTCKGYLHTGTCKPEQGRPSTPSFNHHRET